MKSMYNILNTMKRIGNPRFGEIFADGIWGPRTNNSLLNAAAITDAVAKLGKDLGMRTTINLNKVEELKSLIPPSDTDIDQEEKVKRVYNKLLCGTQYLKFVFLFSEFWVYFL